MPLSLRQELLYTHTANHYRATETLDGSDKTPTGFTYALANTAVPLFFEIRGSVSAPSALGQIEGDNMFTLDSLWVADDLVCDEEDCFQNTTPGKNYGRCWLVRGQPRSVSQDGTREGQLRELLSIQIQDPPQGIPRLI